VSTDKPRRSRMRTSRPANARGGVVGVGWGGEVSEGDGLPMTLPTKIATTPRMPRPASTFPLVILKRGLMLGSEWLVRSISLPEATSGRF
jgi:hypothetical protein